MIPVKCPRCLQLWYTDDEDAGRVRLCSGCADELRKKQRRSPFRIDAFVIGVAVLLMVDIALMLLAGFWPADFGKALLIYGFVLLVPGLVGIRVVRRVGGGEIDWTIARWLLLMLLMGLGCLLAYYSFVTRAQQEEVSRGRDNDPATVGVKIA
jgi:hypothetical protein